MSSDFNRLGANYNDELQHTALLSALAALEEARKALTADGRMYGQVKLSKKMQAAQQVMNQMPQGVI